ncbi:MAG: hypothetical protein M3Z56_04680 [Bacteroidota bacterium]|nr:hypothetical protein [Bacteroidota bacterium]
MQTLLVEIESDSKAKELTSILTSLNFVKRVSAITKTSEMLEALKEHETIKAYNVKKKNKAIAKYL